ncbi:MAG: hypothetical protein Fur0014_16400 [Rubrivivax sp.]
MHILLSLLLGAALAAPALAAPDADETRRLHTPFERHWGESARLFPEGANFRGDRRYDHLWSDASPAGEAMRRDWLQRGADQALPRLFAERPRLPYGVRPRSARSSTCAASTTPCSTRARCR